MGWVGSGWVWMDDGNRDNRANSVQPKLKLGLSLAIALRSHLISVQIETKLDSFLMKYLCHQNFYYLSPNLVPYLVTKIRYSDTGHTLKLTINISAESIMQK